MSVSAVRAGAVDWSSSTATTAKEFHQLGKALRQGNLDAAKDAYKAILKNPPPNATWNPEGSFAQLGKALARGDMAQARSIATEAVKEIRSSRQSLPPMEDPVPAGAETMATTGSTLDVTA
ncbi:hypothetical protein KGA65_19515 [Ideonella sp. B7]|uniref:hypothetical protein n=1 Tax=Ideonella benzenivorans TaxID=2831643 RepID=UPI001CEE030A|nr:hypothetical protein [Ideonella benzenivorans]MCA6218736.1 hypothetical protein [Ideonella benzenivorans]